MDPWLFTSSDMDEQFSENFVIKKAHCAISATAREFQQLSSSGGAAQRKRQGCHRQRIRVSLDETVHDVSDDGDGHNNSSDEK
ncbi:hypothetical protein N7457_000136 [Penicillium paradoxum]|uniref:uncharacterized protein n=1 Tax=Penicillium paradoxum TaxID=176176 RepID=UPI0025476348|nr:uncharacterized protein N7457_000136 [Penicillium paradoxum]KAJ5793537.1 hypothetical protein N7457_000136 [Penicillium paradoxum]